MIDAVGLGMGPDQVVGNNVHIVTHSNFSWSMDSISVTVDRDNRWLIDCNP